MNNKKRWAQKYDCCTRCGKTDRRHVGYGVCQLCWQRDRRAQKKVAKKHMPVILNEKQKSLLLPIETEQKFGYKVEDLSFGTPRKVIHRCDVCGEPKETPFREFVLGQKLGHFKCKVVKMKRTNLKRFGTEFASQSPQVQQKMKQTFLREYGVTNSQLDPEVRRKKEETNLARHGVKYPLESQAICHKAQQSLKQHYGVDHPGESPEIQAKIKQTCIERYGVERPLQCPEIRERWNKTNTERYGVEFPAQSEAVREKMKQTMIEEHGVEHYVQLPEERNRLINWCRENPEKMYTPKSELAILQWI